ncbi:MAG: hypothetical protein WA252_14160 [Candidatus Sulfotelmatobacter sp.]
MSRSWMARAWTTGVAARPCGFFESCDFSTQRARFALQVFGQAVITVLLLSIRTFRGERA